MPQVLIQIEVFMIKRNSHVFNQLLTDLKIKIQFNDKFVYKYERDKAPLPFYRIRIPETLNLGFRSRAMTN